MKQYFSKKYHSGKQMLYELSLFYFSKMLVISSAILSSLSQYLCTNCKIYFSYLFIYVFTLSKIKSIRCCIHKDKSLINAYVRIILYYNMSFCKEIIFQALKSKAFYICLNLQINKNMYVVQLNHIREQNKQNDRWWTTKYRQHRPRYESL